MRTGGDPGTGPAVRAAGGVVVRATARGLEAAAVHRPKYGDWSLPKGKLDSGEGWAEAALREVAEETGLRCELLRELEPVRYRDRKGRQKLVRWWLMRALGGEFTPSDEVDELRWIGPGEDLELLDYEHDRELVRAAVSLLTETVAAPDA